MTLLADGIDAQTTLLQLLDDADGTGALGGPRREVVVVVVQLGAGIGLACELECLGDVVVADPAVPRRVAQCAVVIQGFGLALFGFNALREPSDDITTVADVPASRPNAPAVRVVFTPDASIADINTLLAHQGLSIVAGPGSAGNFTAELSADAVASGASANSVADVMAKDPNVRFAQPVAH